MTFIDRMWNGNSGRDRVFWLVVGGLLLAYALVALDIVYVLITLATLVVAVSFHEFGHAVAADVLDDPTPRMMGRLTLDPRAHLDPAGTLMMVVMTVTGFGIGWGKPVVITPYRLKHGPRVGGALVSLAGPMANFLLALISGLVLRFLSDAPESLFLALNVFVWTNLALMMFNLLPFPPLDGYSILLGLLSLSRGQWATVVSEFLLSIRRYGTIILIAVLLLSQLLRLNLFGILVSTPASVLFRLIVG